MSNGALGIIPAVFGAGASILILDTVTGKTKRVHIKNKSKVKVNDCHLEGITECTEDCVKCKLTDLKSERLWLEQQYETSD